MSFIRPEAKAKIWRWREALIGFATIVLGLWWGAGGGILQWIGFVVIVLGGALTVAGYQRARFRGGAGGPGVVTIDEGQVTYFGPLSGGMVAVSDMVMLTLDPTTTPAVWRLKQMGQPEIQIPVNAEGADALFDVFSTLPGLRTEAMLAHLTKQPDHPVVIWQKQAVRLH